MTWIPPDFEPPEAVRTAASHDGWADAARAAHDRHGLALAHPPRMFASGSVVVMDCGQTVFKLTPPCWAEEIRNEVRSLAAAHGRLPVATPEVLGTGALAGWEYVVMSRLAGVSLGEVWRSLDTSERRRLASRLGELSAALGDIAVAELAVEPWEAFLARMRRTACERQRHHAPEAWLDRIDPYLDSIDPLTPGPTVLLHTELLGEHVLVAERRGRWELSGLLDFADARMGHPAYEVPAVVEFIFRGERPLLGDYLRASGVPHAEGATDAARELLGWGLLHQFGSVKRLLAACGAPAPTSFEEIAERLYTVE